MPRPFAFKVVDAQGGNPTNLPIPPEKISSHRLRAGDEWRPLAPRSTGVKRQKGGRTKSKVPKTVKDVLGEVDEELDCVYCGEVGTSKDCSNKCYTAFRRETLLKDKDIDIRDVGALGHGAFTRNEIRKGQYIAEYIGELRPLTVEDETSLYRLVINGRCSIDSELAGNWTRFVNSSCQPNIRPWTSYLGKRHCVLFQALRSIDAGEELTFQYGKAYFEAAGFLCGCDAQEGQHEPFTIGKQKGKLTEKAAKKAKAVRKSAKTARVTKSGGNGQKKLK